MIGREPDITIWKDTGIYQVKISLDNPLRWVNSYILQDGSELTLIDPGPRTPSSESEWAAALRRLGWSPLDISSIVVTHHHPDHYGLAGWFQEQSGAIVRMSERARQEAVLMWGEGSDMSERLPAFFADHGMPDSWLRLLPQHLDSFIPQVAPSPRVTYVTEGAAFRMGGRDWMPVQSGGHAPGHLVFHDEADGILLCGDAVLPQISPNVSLVPGSDAEPLQLYLAGLRRLRELHVRAAYPGHRHPFTHFRERIDALLAHHEERLDIAAGLLRQAPGGLTAFDVTIALFGGKLGIHQMRFAMSEALAHLAELVRRGRAEMKQRSADGAYTFTAAL